jgi:Flp pilus assembly pilin Flp
MGCREGCAVGCLGVLVAVVAANPLIGAIVVVGGWVLNRFTRRSSS